VFVAIVGDEDVVLDAHTDSLLRDIDAWLHGNHHARLERQVIAHGVVNVQADRVAQPMDKVLA